MTWVPKNRSSDANSNGASKKISNEDDDADHDEDDVDDNSFDPFSIDKGILFV